jgi:hypothetical protein
LPTTGSRPLDRQVGAISRLVAGAGAAHARLRPLVRRAEDAAEHAERSSDELRRREERLKATSNDVRRIVAELNDLLRRCERTLAAGRREQRSAQTLTDRLAAQAQRSRRIAGAAAFVVGSDARRDRPANADQNRGAATSDGNAEAGQPNANGTRRPPPSPITPARSTHPDRMKQMLQNTRDSLSELRSIVHGGAARSQRGAGPTTDGHDAKATDRRAVEASPAAAVADSPA